MSNYGTRNPDWSLLPEAEPADSPEPSTPPAQPSGERRAAAGGHPGTLDGPGVLGRALLDRHGCLWQWRAGDLWGRGGSPAGGVCTRSELETEHGPVRVVLLVDPAAGRVLDAARRVAEMRTLGDAADWRQLAADHRELRAAVDAYDRPTTGGTTEQYEAVRQHADQQLRASGIYQTGLLAGLKVGRPAIGCLLTTDNDMQAFAELPDCPACEGTGKDLPPDWRSGAAEPAPAVVRCSCGAAITHATADGYGRDGCDDPVPADHQQLHEALAEAEQRAAAAEDRAVTASAEQQWAADAVCRRCGHGLSAAEPAPEPAVVKLAEGVHWLGEVVGNRPAEPEDSHSLTDHARLPTGPAPEPAGTGPGWERFSIHAAQDTLRHGGKQPDLADQVGALLAHFDMRGRMLRRANNAQDQLATALDIRSGQLHQALTEKDHLADEISRLARHIMEKIPGEPAASEGAVDCAIRLLETAAGGEVVTLRWARDEALSERDAARAELAEVRRDAAFYALRMAGAQLATRGNHQGADLVRGLALDIRDHRRPVPGSPQPADPAWVNEVDARELGDRMAYYDLGSPEPGTDGGEDSDG